MVWAGNDFLADYARQFNSAVEVVPTTIDTEQYVPVEGYERADPLTIGWSGSITTMEHFKPFVPVLKRVKERLGDRVRFELIGDPSYREPELGIVGRAWSAATEVEDLKRFDIGVMPLPDDEWSRGKCGLKGLQYMALAIPTVMSPVGRELEDHHGRRERPAGVVGGRVGRQARAARGLRGVCAGALAKPAVRPSRRATPSSPRSNATCSTCKSSPNRGEIRRRALP